MSLPVVSYGKYNYGQYSNPTPIRFTGGFGAGIAQGITTGVKEIVRQTIVYSDGSMIILVKDGNVFRIERRNK